MASSPRKAWIFLFLATLFCIVAFSSRSPCCHASETAEEGSDLHSLNDLQEDPDVADSKDSNPQGGCHCCVYVSVLWKSRIFLGYADMKNVGGCCSRRDPNSQGFNSLKMQFFGGPIPEFFFLWLTIFWGSSGEFFIFFSWGNLTPSMAMKQRDRRMFLVVSSRIRDKVHGFCILSGIKKTLWKLEGTFICHFTFTKCHLWNSICTWIDSVLTDKVLKGKRIWSGICRKSKKRIQWRIWWIWWGGRRGWGFLRWLSNWWIWCSGIGNWQFHCILGSQHLCSSRVLCPMVWTLSSIDARVGTSSFRVERSSPTRKSGCNATWWAWE